MRWAGALVVAAGLACSGAAAQEFKSPVLIVDQERVFSESRIGEEATAEIEAQSAALAAENREIETQLIAEERALTEERADHTPEAFRELANAFDVKVQSLRDQQDEKARAIARTRDERRKNFVQEIVPVLSEIVRERGALVVLERRDVFLSAELIDITDAVIARMEAQDPPSGEPTADPEN